MLQNKVEQFIWYTLETEAPKILVINQCLYKMCTLA